MQSSNQNGAGGRRGDSTPAPDPTMAADIAEADSQHNDNDGGGGRGREQEEDKVRRGVQRGARLVMVQTLKG